MVDVQMMDDDLYPLSRLVWNLEHRLTLARGEVKQRVRRLVVCRVGTAHEYQAELRPEKVYTSGEDMETIRRLQAEVPLKPTGWERCDRCYDRRRIRV